MTNRRQPHCRGLVILIHTSVKLVTNQRQAGVYTQGYFNPHEREARDQGGGRSNAVNAILIHTSVKLVTGICWANLFPGIILIHTSVKLVTKSAMIAMTRELLF